MLSSTRLLGAAALCCIAAHAKVTIREDRFYQPTTNNLGDLDAIVKTALRRLPICRSTRMCDYYGTSDGRGRARSISHSEPDYRRNEDKENGRIFARSYYGSSYGASPILPALYPAIDTVSVLASLAFLAFLLHSFSSLFDRSRSIFPSIVSNQRQASEDRGGISDTLKLVLRALDDYDVATSDNAIIHQQNTKKSGKTPTHR